MDIEKILTIAAPPARVWELLLDPQVMGACIPGMQSVEVVSPTEYKALIAVKIAFISAKFRLKTTILEQRVPFYLRCEGTGEDSSVASSLKQHSEMFLAEQADGSTELRVKVKVDVLGRLGSFGLGVMKTKADRMWSEFGENLSKRIAPQPEPAPEAVAVAPAPAASPDAAFVPQAAPDRSDSARVVEVIPRAPAATGWWPRLLAALLSRRSDPACARHIRIELMREGATVTVHWPLEGAGECAALLRECLSPATAKE